MPDKEFYLTKERVRRLEADILANCEEALKYSRADETEIVVIAQDEAVTRFANSQIHQNNFERNAFVSVRAAYGKMVAKVTGNDLTREGIKELISKACQMAKVAPADVDFPGFPKGPFAYPFKVEYYEDTACLSPDERAKALLKVFEMGGNSYKAAGVLSNSAITFVVVNSHKVCAGCNATSARFTVLYTGENSSGYSEDQKRDFSALDIERCASRALAKAEASKNPYSGLPSGTYTVVLEEECVATMVNFLSWLGFSAKDYQDKESFLYGKLGEKVTGENITIIDDASDERTLGLPFDFEGVPKKKLVLIENGVAKGYAHNYRTAKKEGVESTGHHVGIETPLPINLVMSAGSAEDDELIASTDYGILVSRFHYTNVVNPKETVITGMTRDGTFLIEGGKLTKGLTNFRFTQNILKALENCVAISKSQRLSSSFFGGGAVVPKIKVENFNFSGKTEF